MVDLWFNKAPTPPTIPVPPVNPSLVLHTSIPYALYVICYCWFSCLTLILRENYVTVDMVMRSKGVRDRDASTTIGLPSIDHGMIGGHLSPEGMCLLCPFDPC